MIIVVRCFTCNKALSARYNKYKQLVEKYRKEQKIDDVVLITSNTTPEEIKKLMTTNKTPERKALDDLNITNYCCVRHMMTDLSILDI
jgi:DNA-directed RNA polymerase subunit N (RpoN/RPB10)